MFPETNDITFSSSVDIHGTRSYLFDFDTGDFVVRDGKLIECDGIDAVKVWIETILRTEKGRLVQTASAFLIPFSVMVYSSSSSCTLPVETRS